MTQPYNQVDMFSTEIVARKLTEEERELVSQTRERTMKPVEFEEAIAYAIRRKKHDLSPTRRMGTNVGKVMRQLGAFWEGRGGMDDGSIYKAVPELAVEIKASERQTRTALEVAIEEGMLTRTPIIRPSDRRQVYSYLCDPVRTLRVACYGRLEHLRARLSREGRPKHAAKLERDVEGVEDTLRDLDEWFGPEEAGVAEQGGWVEGEPLPDFADEDAPEPMNEDASDWLPDADYEATLTLNPADTLTATADIPPATAVTSRPLQKRTPEEYAEESPLQGGAVGSLSRTASSEGEEGLSAPGPVDDAPLDPAALQAAPPPPDLSVEIKNRVYGEIFGIVGDGDVKRLCEQYLDGEPVTVEQIAEAVREKVGGDARLSAFVPWVTDCLMTREAERREAAV